MGRAIVETDDYYQGTILKTTDVIEEDLVYRKVALNLRANDNFISVIKLDPPYNMLVDLTKISTGRLRATLNEPTYKTAYMRYYETISNLGIRSRSYND